MGFLLALCNTLVSVLRTRYPRCESVNDAAGPQTQVHLPYKSIIFTITPRWAHPNCSCRWLLFRNRNLVLTHLRYRRGWVSLVCQRSWRFNFYPTVNPLCSNRPCISRWGKEGCGSHVGLTYLTVSKWNGVNIRHTHAHTHTRTRVTSRQMFVCKSSWEKPGHLQKGLSYTPELFFLKKKKVIQGKVNKTRLPESLRRGTILFLIVGGLYF